MGLVKQTNTGASPPLPPILAMNPGKGFFGEPAVAEKTIRNRRAEYLLVIYPEGDLQKELIEEQRRFIQDFGAFANHSGKPHLLMAAFQAGEAMEDILIRWIQRICIRHRSFELMLNNYSGIPPHTVYLRVQDHRPFRDLSLRLGAIDDFIRSSGCPPVNLIGHPYLPIASGLTKNTYEAAMPEYAQRTFHGSFWVRELVLLKRDHPFDDCRPVNVFRLPA